MFGQAKVQYNISYLVSTNMWFSELEYPRAQNFAIRFITEGFYPGSVIILPFIAVLNTDLVGNDIVSELRKSPENTDTKWWALVGCPRGLETKSRVVYSIQSVN
ncbi:hypothetical protein B0J17DRAFT_629110 [Rhizoctonia solani]|nr:hypothetical protein B0J17DRAFT_629110 [Rhizoctonia solani]